VAVEKLDCHTQQDSSKYGPVAGGKELQVPLSCVDLAAVGHDGFQPFLDHLAFEVFSGVECDRFGILPQPHQRVPQIGFGGQLPIVEIHQLRSQPRRDDGAEQGVADDCREERRVYAPQYGGK